MGTMTKLVLDQLQGFGFLLLTLCIPMLPKLKHPDFFFFLAEDS